LTKRPTGNRQKKVVTPRGARGGQRLPRATPPRPRVRSGGPSAEPRHGGLIVRRATGSDAAGWSRMRAALWPDGSEKEHGAEIEQFLAGRSREPAAVLIADDARGEPVGFAELSIRPFAEGCRTGRVAYLEGWYVIPEVRRQGFGRALVEAAERWARAQGCSELASDREPDNAVSGAAHRALGFAEVGVVVCYRKAL
jgi:aminoglycoside 6'-N-acetyltransferase I